MDLNKVLLPKKPTPGATTDSAQRVNAGALLEQEQQAKREPLSPSQPKPAAPPPPKVKKPEEPMIAPLQTFKGDIESLIENTNASTVSIAAAEAARRAQAPVAAAPARTLFNWKGLLKRFAIIIAGLILLAAAGTLALLVYSRLTGTVVIPPDAVAPFITVDGTTRVAYPAETLRRPNLMDLLVAARDANELSLGLIGNLEVYETIPGEDEDTYNLFTIETLLTTLAPDIPQELLRTLTGTYLFGVHTYDGSQPFLLIETDSYERTFAGMLQWESSMRQDLLPLFAYEPRPRVPEEGVATSSVGTVPQLIQTGFSDKIIENRDARVVLNTAGDVLFLWAPLGNHLFVITTNEYTLREIISRLGL